MNVIDQTGQNTAAETSAQAVAARRPASAVSTETKILLAILAVLCIWGFAIFTFGVPALVWPMKLIVPGLVLSLVLLTWGM